MKFNFWDHKKAYVKLYATYGIKFIKGELTWKYIQKNIYTVFSTFQEHYLKACFINKNKIITVKPGKSEKSRIFQVIKE